MVSHEVISHERRDFLYEIALAGNGNVVVHEAVERMNSLESVVVVVFIQILSLNVPSVLLPVGTGIVHHYSVSVRTDLLRAECQIETLWEEHLRLC